MFVVWTESSGFVFRFRVVREFCFVKYDASGVSVWDGGGEIPAFAGMTWVGAGMTWEGLLIADCRLLIEDWRMRFGLREMDSRLRGNDGVVAGMT